MRYRVVHRTEYEYTTDVHHGYNEARLTPRTTAAQQCRSFALEIQPEPGDLRARDDYFGNRTTYFASDQPHRHLVITATSEVDVTGGFDIAEASVALSWEQVRDAMVAPEARNGLLEARQYCLPSPLINDLEPLRAYALPTFTPGRGLIDAVLALNDRIFAEFAFDPLATTVSTPLADVLEHRRGVCQDFAHLLIGCLRSMGLAARYVSGYIETDPPPDGEKLVGSDASHAWVSVYVPDHGWLDLDPTNAQIPGDRHIITAWGRDYGDVTPLKGVVFSGGGFQTLTVAVDVARIDGEDAQGR